MGMTSIIMFRQFDVCRLSILEFLLPLFHAHGVVISFLVTRCAFLWAPRAYGRHSPKLASLRHRLGAVTNAALITKVLLSSLQNDMPPPALIYRTKVSICYTTVRQWLTDVFYKYGRKYDIYCLIPTSVVCVLSVGDRGCHNFAEAIA